jgi:hypothetical protein
MSVQLSGDRGDLAKMKQKGRDRNPIENDMSFRLTGRRT